MTDDNDQRPLRASRREALRCLGWAGTGTLWTLSGGVAGAVGFGEAALGAPRASGFSFAQVSDSHIGFAKPANPDARATFREAIGKIKALPDKPAFILHTGDITQLSREAEFDDAQQILGEAGLPVFHTPGEHDMLDEQNGKAYLDRFGGGSKGDGWYSFDHGGVHFVALVNVKLLQPGGMGRLGPDQLAWLKADLGGLSASTPIVVFTHMPLWTISAEWGWGTDDAAEALSHLRRFGSVTILSGHIHQIIEKTEGHLAFHTARSTAFPQPAPGTAPSPGPMTVPAGRLRSVLGVREVRVVPGRGPLAVLETPLGA